jgi:hypothetical protein
MGRRTSGRDSQPTETCRLAGRPPIGLGQRRFRDADLEGIDLGGARRKAERQARQEQQDQEQQLRGGSSRQRPKDKPRGGQPRAPGHGLCREASPDQRLPVDPPAECRGCGDDLSGAADAGLAWSQTWNVKIIPWRTEYLLPRRRYGCTTTTVAARAGRVTGDERRPGNVRGDAEGCRWRLSCADGVRPWPARGLHPRARSLQPSAGSSRSLNGLLADDAARSTVASTDQRSLQAVGRRPPCRR